MEPEQLAEIKERCTAIPGGEDWWHADNGTVFIDATVEMVKMGFTISHAIEIVSHLYWAVVNEFGS